MVSEEEMREFVNHIIKGFAQLVLQHNGNTSAAMMELQIILLNDPTNMRREELTAMIAFMTRRLFYKRSDLVQFSAN